jgi:2-oxoglutarate ferredoxin oxidoreductase subunit alpha
MDQPEVIVGIGGAAGDGVASAGNTLALSVARQGQGVYAYNSYQSVIRGGHSWLRMRISAKKPLHHGDQVGAMIALNQDTLDRHLQELVSGGAALYNSAKIKPSYDAPKGVQLCPLPVPELTSAGHAEHGGGWRPPAADGTGILRTGIGPRLDVRQKAAGREDQRRCGPRRL